MTHDKSEPLRGSIAFVVLSCDRYADLWTPCFSRIRRHWPQLDLETYVLSNELACDSHGFLALRSGADSDWSSSVRRSIEQLNHSHVFFWFEDAFLNEPVDDADFRRHWRWALDSGVDYLRFRSLPKPDERAGDNVGRLNESKPYRNTCFAALWKRSTFLSLLRDGESAADFEMQGTLRSAKYPAFYGAYTQRFSYLHGVVRGRWLPSVLSVLRASGDVTQTTRRVMSRREEILWRLLELKGRLAVALPAGWANRAFAAKRALVRGLD